MAMKMVLSLIFCLTVSSFSANATNILFKIMRNLNRNIVVYEANFDSNGILNYKTPIKVYWILKEKNNRKEALNYIEKKMAYGIKWSSSKETPNTYNIRLVADDSRKFVLKQIAPFKAAIFTFINSKKCELKEMFIQADNKSFMPKVKFIELNGTDNFDKKETEKYVP